MSSSFVEARNRLLNGEGSLGARGYIEDAMRARGQLPKRHSAPKVEAAFAHFADTKHRLVDLEEENEHLRGQLHELQGLAARATDTLSKQREQLGALYSKPPVTNVTSTDSVNSGFRFGGGDHLKPAIAGCGTRSDESVPGEVL